MTAEIRQLETHPGPGRMATPQLRTLVVCDIADSTALVERMGDQNAANIIRKHDRLARALIERHKGREIDKTDGFLLLFERPIQAAAFALDYQRALKHLSAAEGVVVRARVGIHMGDVVIWENAPEDVARGAKPIEVEGLVKPVAARLAQLAKPQQILMSSAVADIAHRAEGELGHGVAVRVHWKTHGRYRFKGLPDPIEVVEAGETDVAPLHAPRSVRTARRVLPWWRRPLTLAAEAAMLLIGIGVGAWFLLQSPPTLAFAARDWVVVGGVQNHTNQSHLGTPLDAAIKIGLEQSRYVNVIPNIQVDSALKRMEKPAGTAIDRAIGSDVAMREGARALILPSLAQVGGKILISAEVIDPQTGVTVYSDSTQAEGASQILPATDKLLGELRSRLGESLASIQKTSVPLAQITTSNLDALRAYGKAEQDLGTGRVNAALLMLHEALRLDPKFALAWGRLGTIQLGYLNDPEAARASLQAAAAHRDRLSLRERLTVDGILAQFTDARKSIGDFATAVEMYPDDASAQQNLGLGLLWFEHQLADAKPHLLAVAHSRHPLRALSYYSLALVETELGNTAQAEADVAQGRKLGTWSPHFEDVLPDLAAKHYRAVLARIHSAPANLPLQVRAEGQIRVAAVALDQGQFHDASAALERAATLAAQAKSDGQQFRIRLGQVALAYAQADSTAEAQLQQLVRAEVKRAVDAKLIVGDQTAIQLDLAAMLATRHGDAALAREALDASRGLSLDHGYYDRAALWRTADCEVRFAADPAGRVACLQKLVDRREYSQTHVALLLAYQAQGDASGVRTQAQWLVAHRGQAIAELEEFSPALVMNLLDQRRAVAALAASPR
jgi:putative peptide modification system cyclase